MHGRSKLHTHASSDDHGQFCYARAKEAPGLVAVVATLSKGYDLEYIWKQVDRGPAKDAASYYLQASESGGEPPGRWWGPGAKALGFGQGRRIERQPYDLLFGRRQAPDGTPLGRPPASGRKAAEVYKALLAAEPHATAFHGRETGQWREADLAVAHWLQHTSRDGDMQLHVHSQIAHTARTATDGKWRAPDSLGYNEHVGAVAAIVFQHLEEALTRRFGLEWTARDDGHGFEITGIGGEMMRLFSSRRESITADLRGRAAQFEQHYGRKPSQREFAHLAQASNFTTRNPKHGALDLAQLHAGWADKLARTLGVSLSSVAPSVWHGPTGPPAPPRPGAQAPV